MLEKAMRKVLFLSMSIGFVLTVFFRDTSLSGFFFMISQIGLVGLTFLIGSTLIEKKSS